MQVVRLIAGRELAESLGGRSRLARLLLLGGALPVIFLFLLRSQAAGPGYSEVRLRTAAATIYTQVGVMPLSAGMAAAATSFAAEFETGTIIPLLASPVRTSAVFWGKFLAALTSAVGLGWFAQGTFVALFGALLGKEWPLPLTATMLMSAGVPIFVFPFLAGAMALGSRARRVKSAQTNSSLAFIAILAAVLYVAFRRPSITGTLVLWTAAGWLLFGVLLLSMGIRFWDREEMVGRL